MAAVDHAAFEAVRAAKDAAYWAAWSGVASWVVGLASLAVTAGGLVFIYRQLLVAELNAKAAVDAAHAALLAGRPWLAVGIRDGSVGVRPPGEPMTLNVTVTMENVGNAPALDVEVITLVVAAEAWPARALTMFRAPKDRIGFLRGALLQNRRGETPIAAGWNPRDPGLDLLVVVCAYTIPGVPGRRFTAKPYTVAVGNLKESDDRVSISHIRLDPADHLQQFMT